MEINAAKTVSQLISAISFALDIDEGTELYHAWRVAIFGGEIAKTALPNERKNIFYASCLHDVGGINLPGHIMHYLHNPDISKEPAMFAHPFSGADIVSLLPRLEQTTQFILSHHERYDGKGYPFGRRGDSIPKPAQIIGIADQIDILLRNGNGATQKDFIAEVELWRNNRFSSELVDHAVTMLENKAFLNCPLDKAGIRKLFEKTNDDIGDIFMPNGTDAIGITCEVFSQLTDTKHPCTTGHAKRVARYSLLIASALYLSHDDMTKIKWSALLHDIGKLGVSKKLLDKPGALTPEEHNALRAHAALTRDVLNTVTDFEEIASIAGSNHERYDGNGYPDGLAGKKIPESSRIIAIADAFDAMTLNRPYGKTITVDKACEEITKNSGTQFDPVITKEALHILRNINLN